MLELTQCMRALLGRIGPPVAVVGSANADLTVRTTTLPRPGETVIGSEVTVLPGGKSSNQAVQAALLGAQVSFVGALGDDGNGQMLWHALESAGVDLQHSRVFSRRTGSAIIAVDRDGENLIIVDPGTNDEVNASMVARSSSAIEEARVLGLCLESPLPGVLAAAEIASRSGTTVMVNLSPFHNPLPELLKLVDVVIVNEGELERLLEGPAEVETEWADPRQRSALVGRLQDRGIRRAIVTLGAEGSVVVDQGTAIQVPGCSIDVVDTTGCGDSFFGTVLAASAAGASLLNAAQLASIVSAVAATGTGAQSSYTDRTALLARLGTS